MRFVIVGYGRVGRRTASLLESEGHDLTVIETDPEKAEQARVDDVDIIEGDGEDEAVLNRADLETADAVGGLTGDLNVNFAACMAGAQHDCRTVMRIDEDYREEIYEKYAEDVDEVVYPERLGAAGAKNAMLGGDLNVLSDVTQNITIAVVEVPEGSPLVGKRVVEVELPGETRIYAHGPKNESMEIPMPRTVIEAGDRVAFLAEQEDFDEAQAAIRAADA
jgi:trk system potassium uptake protein TrkA